MRKRRQIRAFTLIELLLVLVILAILAAVVIPKFVGRGEQARETAAKTDIAGLSSGLDTFEVDNGRYPTGEEGLGALTAAPSGLSTTWHGPYVKSSLNDPWGAPYVYRNPGTHNANGFDLFSTKGGKDSSGNDINNWTNAAPAK